MSGRQKLPQEELEVHNLLSPSASSTVSVSPGQRHPVANLPKNDHSYSNENNNNNNTNNNNNNNSKINQENLDTFKSMFKQMNNFINKIDDSGDLKNQIRKECFGSSDSDEVQSGDEEFETDDETRADRIVEDLPMNNPTKQVSFFGVHVNEPKSSEDELPYGTQGRAPFEIGALEESSATHPVVDENNNNSKNNNHKNSVTVPSVIVNSAAPVEATAPVRAPIEPIITIKPALSSSIAAASGSSAPDPASVTNLPDPSLPMPTSRPPKNWDPDPSVLLWASKTLESCEWTKEDREFFVNKFSTDPDHDPLFSAVPNPPDLLAAIKSPELVDKDFLFKRAETENFLFSANEDLACGFRPLLEVLSDLKDKGMNETRTKLAYVFQSMSSAICKISRSRRELGRRFVPLDSAPALFKNKPSPQCLFGSNSLESAIEKAVEAKKVNKDLIYVPRKRKSSFNYPSSGSRLLGKIYKGKFQRSSNSYNNNKQYDRRKFFPEKQDSRRRQRRGGRRSWNQNWNQSKKNTNQRNYK